MSEYRTMFIGADDQGERVVGGDETQRQITGVKGLVCRLVDPDDGSPIPWSKLDDPEEGRTLFQAILRDRRIRVDQHQLMADRPPFAVVTAAFPDDPGGTGEAIRLEYYEGHDALECTFDLRSAKGVGKALPRWMESDPQSYDPAAFLKDVFGLPTEWTNPLLDEVHRRLREKRGQAMTDVERVANQFFIDLQTDPTAPRDREEALRGWLWFSCPATMRTDVEAAIRARWEKA